MDSDEKTGVLEETTATSFFQKHGSHMPVSFQIAADIEENEDVVTIEIKHPGLSESDFDVDADVNTVKLKMIFDDTEGGSFTHTFHTPSPIDPDNVRVEGDEDWVKVTALKKKPAD